MFVLNEFHTDMMIHKLFVLYLNLKEIIEILLFFRFNINILPGGNVETGFSVGCVGAEDDSLK